MPKYGVSVVIYSYIEVEADSLENANYAYSSDNLKLINPDVADVFDDGVLGYTVPLSTFDGECILSHVEKLKGEVRLLAEGVRKNDWDIDSAIMELRRLGYSKEDALYAIKWMAEDEEEDGEY